MALAYDPCVAPENPRMKRTSEVPSLLEMARAKSPYGVAPGVGESLVVDVAGVASRSPDRYGLGAARHPALLACALVEHHSAQADQVVPAPGPSTLASRLWSEPDDLADRVLHISRLDPATDHCKHTHEGLEK